MSFLALAGQYRLFIRNFAESSGILNAATVVKIAFEEFKERLKKPPLLPFPDFDSAFLV